MVNHNINVNKVQLFKNFIVVNFFSLISLRQTKYPKIILFSFGYYDILFIIKIILQQIYLTCSNIENSLSSQTHDKNWMKKSAR